jgi:hypothetical protein
MPITRITGRLILVAVLLIFSHRPTASVQTEPAEIASFRDLLQMLAAQPDHQADWKVVINEEKFGVHMTRYIKFARKRNKTRQEVIPWRMSRGRIKLKGITGYSAFSSGEAAEASE